MTSTIRFKFWAEWSYSNLPFDGHYITVGELKRLIAEKKGLGANDLHLTEATSKRDYYNDAENVMKNSSVIVKRVASTARPKTIVSSAAPAVAAVAAPALGAVAPGPALELAALARVDDDFGEDPLTKAATVQQEELEMGAFISLAAMGVGWEAKLALQLANQGRRGFGAGGGRGSLMMNRECWRCGQLGHSMSACPTQADPAYDKRIKVPSGIPASKIQRSADGSLYLPDGELGELAPNTQEFNKLAARMGRSKPTVTEAAAVAGDPDAPVSATVQGQAATQPPAIPQAATPSYWQQQGAEARSPGDLQQQIKFPQQQQQWTLHQQQQLNQQQRQHQQQHNLQQQPIIEQEQQLEHGFELRTAAMAPEFTTTTVAAVEIKTEPVPTESKPLQPQLFDDDFDDETTRQPAHHQPIKLALGMDDVVRGSVSPAPSRLIESRALGLGPGLLRQSGTAAAAFAAAAAASSWGGGGSAGGSVPGRRQGADQVVDEVLLAPLHGVGCTDKELMRAAPFLRDLLPGDMAMADLFRAFGSGGPLSRREFLDLQAERQHDHEHAGRRRSRGRRSKRSRSGSAGRGRSRSRTRSPSFPKRQVRRHRSRSPMAAATGERSRGGAPRVATGKGETGRETTSRQAVGAARQRWTADLGGFMETAAPCYGAGAELPSAASSDSERPPVGATKPPPEEISLAVRPPSGTARTAGRRTSSDGATSEDSEKGGQRPDDQMRRISSDRRCCCYVFHGIGRGSGWSGCFGGVCDSGCCGCRPLRTGSSVPPAVVHCRGVLQLPGGASTQFSGAREHSLPERVLLEHFPMCTELHLNPPRMLLLCTCTLNVILLHSSTAHNLSFRSLCLCFVYCVLLTPTYLRGLLDCPESIPVLNPPLPACECGLNCYTHLTRAYSIMAPRAVITACRSPPQMPIYALHCDLETSKHSVSHGAILQSGCRTSMTSGLQTA